MSEINQKNTKRSHSAGGRSIKGWVGKNLSGGRLRLGEKPFNKSEDPNKRKKDVSNKRLRASRNDFQKLKKIDGKK